MSFRVRLPPPLLCSSVGLKGPWWVPPLLLSSGMVAKGEEDWWLPPPTRSCRVQSLQRLWRGRSHGGPWAINRGVLPRPPHGYSSDPLMKINIFLSERKLALECINGRPIRLVGKRKLIHPIPNFSFLPYSCFLYPLPQIFQSAFSDKRPT